MSEAERLAKSLEAGERSGMWYPSMEAAAELRRLSAELEKVQGVPEIDYEALITAAHKRDRKWAQGTNGCIAFKYGAEWFRDQLLAFTPPAPQASVVQQEPVAWIRPSGKAMLEAGGYCTVYASEGMSNHSTPLYTHPAQQAKPQPLSDEQDRALCEAYCNTASDEYFNARPQLDSNVNRRIFYAGHRKAWIEWRAAHGIQGS